MESVLSTNMSLELIQQIISESISTKQRLLNSKETIEQIERAASAISKTIDNGGKVLLCGNGGSASDAAHIAGELNGRFQKERPAIPAIALNEINVSLTAVANDYNYDRVFERPLSGLMKKEDILIGISTSGNSENVYRAVCKAKDIGGTTIGFLGNEGGKIADVCDIPIIVPSDITARIQEAHIMIGHIICEIVECRW